MAHHEHRPTAAHNDFAALTGRKVVVIGASAGGLEPLTKIIRALPADLPAAVFVVVHTSPNNPGILPQILTRHGNLTAELARDGMEIRPGTIYVASADRHLLLVDQQMRVTTGPKENGFRPAVDPLFRTAAHEYGPHVIGVILSGGLNDGTYGLILIKRNQGIAIVQDPHDALVSGMPQSARQAVTVDYELPAEEIGHVIARLAKEPVFHRARERQAMAKKDPDETTPDVAQRGGELATDRLYQGPPSGYTCPECGGALWELVDGQLLRFRCHVGHGYTAESLVAEQDKNLENALWAALRGLEEHAELSRQMLARAEEANMTGLVLTYTNRLALAEERANLIRSVLLNARGEGQLKAS